MDIEKVKRYSLVELVLLSFFIIGLLISGLIVKVRQRVLLSPPLELSGSGVAVSIPRGEGWDSTSTWQYEESGQCMAFVGQFRSQRGRGIEVRWRYYFATPAGSEEELLKKQADSIGAQVLRVDTAGQMVYASMVSRGTREERFYVGMRRLDFDRSVELLVKPYGLNSTYEENVFTSLAESMTYRIPDELANGQAWMDTFLQSQSRQDADSLTDEAFVVKDIRGSAVGYYYARQVALGDRAPKLQRIQIRHVDNKQLTLESDLWYHLADKTYRWETQVESFDGRNRHSYKVERGDDGRLTVADHKKSLASLEQVHFFLPEPLLLRALLAFADGSLDKVVFDVVSPSGQMVPVRLEKMDPSQSKIRFKKAVSMIRVNYLHRDDSYEDLQFDISGNLLGKFEQASRRRLRLWEAVDPDALQDQLNLNSQELPQEIVLQTKRYSEMKPIKM